MVAHPLANHPNQPEDLGPGHQVMVLVGKRFKVLKQLHVYHFGRHVRRSVRDQRCGHVELELAMAASVAETAACRLVLEEVRTLDSEKVARCEQELRHRW